MIRQISLLLLLLIAYSSKGQWLELAEFNKPVTSITNLNNYVFFAGDFTICDGDSTYYIASYENGLINMHTDNPGLPGGVNELVSDGAVLVAATNFTVGGCQGISLRTYQGQSWYDPGWCPGHSVEFISAYTYGFNQNYLGSNTGQIVQRDGNGVTDLVSTDGAQDEILCFSRFDNKVVIGGSFESASGQTVNNVAIYDIPFFGSPVWEPMDSGFDSTVMCLQIFNGQLIAGGVFENASGTSAKNIAKWDGSSWSDVGGSVTGTGLEGIRDMMIYNNKLWVVGDFDEIGGVSANGLASWDGTQWETVNFPDLGNGYPCSIDTLGYIMYVGTDEGDGANDTSHVFVVDLFIAGEEELSEIEIEIFPNPSTDVLNIQTAAALKSAVVFDQAGRVVLQSTNGEKQLNVSGLDAGIYMIQCETEKGMLKKKFVKE
jgi:hypothetical protein